MIQGTIVLSAVAVLALIIAGCVILLRENRSMRLILFGFAMVCALLSDMYWFIFDLMYADKELPFAANELGECALFLLLGAVLMHNLKRKRIPAGRELLLAGILIAANTALWIYWNGEWIQDIATGLCIGYLLNALVLRMKYSGEFKSREWFFIFAAAYAAAALQGASVLSGGSAAAVLEKSGYILLVIVSLILLFVSVRELRGSSSERAVVLAFLLFLWCIFAMYMSDGVWYYAEYVGSSGFGMLLMFLALRREVRGV